MSWSVYMQASARKAAGNIGKGGWGGVVGGLRWDRGDEGGEVSGEHTLIRLARPFG